MNHQGHQERQGASPLLERVAFAMLLVLVIARALALETLRDPFDIAPGGDPVPRTLTAAATMWLDWFACVPALMVLISRSITRSPLAWPETGRGAFSRSFVLLLALAVWSAMSPIWSSDKFAAVIGVSHFIASVAILFAAMQLVARDTVRLRIVAGVCFGLMLALIAYGLLYRYVELPQLQEDLQKNWSTIVAQRGWEPGSFTESQFRKKALAGELVGFYTSPNTFAAMIVMLLVVSAGVMIQRLRDPDRDSRPWGVLIAITIPLAIFVLSFTRSRTAFATPILATICFIAVATAGRWIARHHKLVFIVMIALIVVGAGALITLGLSRGDLIQDSLTFRWRYWIGSARLFAQHPILGVGWNNFGDPYLAVREPIAAEEIKDPHNLLVRFATELGIIGLVLSMAWLLWTWWDMTRPDVAVDVDESHGRPERYAAPGGIQTRSALKQLTWIATLGMTINFLTSVDLTPGGWWIFLELLERLLYLALTLIGLIIVTFRSFDRQHFDERPAPWIHRGILVALAVFLIHNIIDFSFFETGPMWTFMLLAGAALGMNSPSPAHLLTSSPPHSTTTQVAPAQATLARPITALAAILWLASLAIVFPITLAESEAHAADELLRTNKPDRAARGYLDAYDLLPFSNSDYLARAARAMAFAGAPVEEIRTTIERAIAANPRSPGNYAFLARFESHQRPPDMQRVIAAFDKFLAMDPADVQSRLLYAQSLERARMTREAVTQYELALAKNAQLHPDEPKRLSTSKLDEISATLTRLRG